MIYTWPMATTVITQVHDDLDSSDGATTRTFAVDGTTWEIDLIDKNHEKLMAALEPFIQVARRSRGAARAATPRSPSLANRKGYTTDEIRAWAKAQGLSLNERGRIPNDIVEQYDNAMSAKPAPAKKAPATSGPAKKAPARKAPAKKATAKAT